MKNAGVENNKLLYYDVDNKIWRCIMKAHKYFAFGSLICLIMAVYSGHKMISGNKRTRKQMKLKEVEE